MLLGAIALFIASLGAGMMAGGLTSLPTELTPGGAIAYAVIVSAVILICILAFVYVMRLSIKLPAVSLGEEYTFGDALRDSKGNIIRLFGFLLLLALPSIFLWAAVSVGHFLVSILLGVTSLAGIAVSLIVWLVVTWAGTLIMHTAKALLYAVFANGVEID